MKFSDGHWLIRDGYSVKSPAGVRGIEAECDRLTVYAPTRTISKRSDTLNGPLLTVTYSSPMPGVIRVQAVHFAGRLHKGPDFDIFDGKPEVKVSDCGGFASFESGNLSVRVAKDGAWLVDFTYGGRELTSSVFGSMAWVKGPGGETYMREQLELEPGEYVYGLGERFTNFVKNGQSVDIWNRDGGTSSDQAYKNIPFYVTNRGYGVLVNNPGNVGFEVGSERVSKVQFSVEGESLDYYVIGGKDLKEVLANYAKLTGKPALPPAWTFGLWLTTSFTTDYDEKTVSSFIDGMAERNIPLSVFHFDCFWMKEYQWCDFEWDSDVFPDPAGMLKRLKARGLKICVWINPYIAQKSKLFADGMRKGYLLHDRDGNVWQWDRWQAGMGLVDFTNPDACVWYQEKLKALLDMGVDCFKTDFGERIPVDVNYFDGSDAMRMHNYYALLYNKTVFDLLERERGSGEAVVFARSATVGGQKYPVHWGGDCTAIYSSMAESLRGGLSLCLSGFGFWSHDIGGFEQTATPDLYKRWAAFGLLSTHSRLHGSKSYRVPWLFDGEAVDVVRFFVRLKHSLMPYLFAEACETARTGVPMLRAMALEFYGDPACDTLDRQYMLGGNLLAAPVFTKTGDVSYYLPEGVWTNFITGERVEGGRWHTEKHGYFSLPLMARPNSLIPVGSSDDAVEYDYADNVSLHLFELGDGSKAQACVNNAKGEQELKVTAQRNGQTIHVSYEGAGKPWTLVMRGICSVQAVRGASLQKTEKLGAAVAVAAGRQGGSFEIEM